MESFLIANMIGRIAGPIVQDLYRMTPWGKRAVRLEDERKMRLMAEEYENKLKHSRECHKDKLAELEKQYQDGRKRAEEQMYLARQEWQQKLFWEKCFPLRNPYELPLGYEPIFNETAQRLECRLKTVSLPNNMQIVPMRVILAFKEGVHPMTDTIASELSMFIVNYFEANGIHAVVSDIGLWRADAPVNDASVNFLYAGAKGIPTMVIVPFFTNNGSMLRIKVWSWGLGEALSYPQGYDFAWLDLEALRRQAMYHEIKGYKSLLEKTGITLPPELKRLELALKRLDVLERHKDKVSTDEFHQLMSMIQCPEELKANVEKTLNAGITAVFACLVAMQADNHHLKEFGTLPLLPSIIGELPAIPFMYSAISSFYKAVINGACIEGIISSIDAMELQLTLCESIARKAPGHECIEDLMDGVRLLNIDNKTNHDEYVKRLRNISNNNKKLLT